MTRQLKPDSNLYPLDPFGLLVHSPPPNSSSTPVLTAALFLKCYQLILRLRRVVSWISSDLFISVSICIFIQLFVPLVVFFFPLIHTWTSYESSKCQLISECLCCLTVMLSSGPLVTLWGCGVSHSCCWDRLQENSQYSNYILRLSSPPSQQPAPPESSATKLNMHYNNATGV